ncbi:hypothetical protein [Sphaerimonospora thailandensis]|uniref:Uncharacterized protein n=1 Tax=Sphaerimonospora thailandensis TaxID=795644 RepID=A0A8J3VYX5_9ACTN|nr:hypothetical protein [Sphaerimonospora thailandensis]GIH69455.1 hypothetical protein Mth01_17080 [Sphaerimonospora thailandensis]
MTLNCPVCAHPMPGHHRVCRACAAGLARDLADVPSLALHLDVAIARQARIGDGGGPRSADALPWDERAAEASAVLRSTLVGWVRVLADGVRETPGPTCPGDCGHRSCTYITLAHPPADTLPALSRWLSRHRAWLTGHPAADEAVDEIRAAVRHARRAIDLPPGLWYAGPCGVADCTADLYARHGARVIRCHECRATHDADARQEWLLAQVADHLGTATEIARALHGFQHALTPSMVRGYAHRGRLAAHGTDEHGRPLYRVGDVLALVSA